MLRRNAVQLLSAALSLLLLVVGVKSATVESENVEAGGRQIAVPAPAGFVRSDGVSVMLEKAVAALLSAANRISRLRLDEHDLRAINPALAQIEAEPAVAVFPMNAATGAHSEFLQVVLRPSLTHVG